MCHCLSTNADTESLYTKATQKIFDRYGKTFDWSIKSKIMGRKPLDAAKHVVEMAKLPLDAADFNEELYKSLETVFPEAQLMPGLYNMSSVFSLHCT